MDLKDKVALITGASSGIGLACVEVFLANGIKGVALVDINETVGNKHCADLNERYGKRSIFIKANVSNKSEFRSAFQTIVDFFGNLDIVINNAGIANEFEPNKCYDVNILGVTNGIQLAIEEFLPKHKSQNSDGFIVNVASIAGLYPSVHFMVPIYNASKCAVLGLTMSFGTDFYYKKHGIKVIAICPGKTNTPLVHEDRASKIVHIDEMLKHDAKIPSQEPNTLCMNVIQILGRASNGSIWKMEGGEFEEMKTSYFGCY